MQFRLTKILDLFAGPFHILLIKLLSLLLVNLKVTAAAANVAAVKILTQVNQMTLAAATPI